jgi:hypothetical protein
MANENWHRAWSNPKFANELKRSAIYQQFDFLGRPYQVAIEILEALDHIGSHASYEEIAKVANLNPMTVSQCINCLARAGYPFAWNKLRGVRVQRGTVTGRIPKGITIAESKEDRVIAILTPFTDKPGSYDLAWKSNLHHGIKDAIAILVGVS